MRRLDMIDTRVVLVLFLLFNLTTLVLYTLLG